MTKFHALSTLRFGLVLAASVPGGVALAQDLNVNGSLCVGFDCPPPGGFGFDTIVLRENNLRIFFDDTSVSAGFPANKWRITINDSASGGASFFSVDDATANRSVFKVTAGAPANSLFVASSGNVGLGTAAPGLDLSISTSDTPAIRLEQTAAGGFTAQTWDIGANEANFFVRDLTGGSRLPFRIRPGAPTSSIDISASGSVGVGTATPSSLGGGATATILNVHKSGGLGQLSLSGDGTADGTFVGEVAFGTTGATSANKATAVITSQVSGSGATNASGNLQLWTRSGTTLAERLTIDSAGNVGIGTTGPTQKLDVNGTVRVATLGANPPANTVCFSAANVLGTCASDARLKHNVRYLQESAGLDAVMKLKPATFQWQDGDERLMAGFIAQETQAAIPAAVHKQAGSEFLSLDTAAVLSYAVRAIQELKADNDKLRSDIERLKASR
ncbi:MAG: hypothetical protein QOF14_1814 [Hyphomicrobiales bacterium]|jgi:hypothetical protein|nr:hypothetical protein [Hyphomicrobiales bacterium]